MIKDGYAPHRALVVLRDADQPLDEQQVWERARRDVNDVTAFHEALNQLRNHAYARRIGRRGAEPYRWEITAEGKKRLQEGQ